MESRIVRSGGRPDVRPERSDQAKTSKTKTSKAGQTRQIKGYGEHGTFFFQRHTSQDKRETSTRPIARRFPGYHNSLSNCRKVALVRLIAFVLPPCSTTWRCSYIEGIRRHACGTRAPAENIPARVTYRRRGKRTTPQYSTLYHVSRHNTIQRKTTHHAKLRRTTPYTPRQSIARLNEKTTPSTQNGQSRCLSVQASRELEDPRLVGDVRSLKLQHPQHQGVLVCVSDDVVQAHTAQRRGRQAEPFGV